MDERERRLSLSSIFSMADGETVFCVYQGSADCYGCAQALPRKFFTLLCVAGVRGPRQYTGRVTGIDGAEVGGLSY